MKRNLVLLLISVAMTGSSWLFMPTPSGGGAPAFNPGDYGTVVLDLNSSDASKVTLSGSDVTKWTDASSNAQDLTCPGVCPTKVSASQNGLDVIRFNGTTQWLRNSSPTSLVDTNVSLTLMVAGKSNSSTNYPIFVCLPTITAGRNSACLILATDTGYADATFGGFASNWAAHKFSIGGVPSGWNLYTVGYNGSGTGTQSNFTPAFNGADETPTASSPLTWGVNVLSVGEITGAFSEFLDGDIGQVVVWSPAITGSSLTSATAAMKARWNTP